MKWRSAARVAATALAVMEVALAACAPALSQEPKSPQVPESARSFPPDRTPYVRPAIPEDRLKTPLPKPRDANTPLPNREREKPPAPRE